MRKRWALSAIALCLCLSVACASAGTSDPTLVKAQDLLSNSLPIYDKAMAYHFANSTRETPQVYQIFEKFRTAFPPAWKALYDFSVVYSRVKDISKLESLVATVQVLINDVLPFLGSR